MDPTTTRPATIELPDMTKGDTWNGIPAIGEITFVTEDDSEEITPDYPLALAEMVWCKEGSDIPLVVLSSRNRAPVPIEIENAETWLISVPPVDPIYWLLESGTYIGRFRLTDTQGYVFTTHFFKQTII